MGKRISLGLGVADFLCSASSYTRPVFSLQNITTVLIKQCWALWRSVQVAVSDSWIHSAWFDEEDL